jgi:hypothetical protein
MQPPKAGGMRLANRSRLGRPSLPTWRHPPESVCRPRRRRARGGTSEAAHEHLEDGDISIDESRDGQVLVTVVGVGSSGTFACDRLVVTDASRRGDEYIVHLQHSPLAFGCNDDAWPRVVRVAVPPEELVGVRRISASQNGSVLGFLPYADR